MVLWAVETVWSVHPLHDNLATRFISVKESLRPNSSKYYRVCEKADISMIIQFILASWGKAPSLSGIPAGSWLERVPPRRNGTFRAGLATSLVGSGSRGLGEEEEPRSSERLGVQCGSRGFRLGLSDSHTCLGEGSKAWKVYLVSHRFQLCISPVGNHSGHSLC